MTARLSFPRLATALAALSLGTTLAWSPVHHGSRIAGTVSLSVDSQHVAPVADGPMHVLTLVRSHGPNRSTGATEYMSGAQVSNVEIADLTQGNGTDHGYITFASGADTTISKWSGTVSTTVGADRQPVTTFKGKWTMVAGTGRYQHASGSGTYRGRMLSPRASTVEWEGDLSGADIATE